MPEEDVPAVGAAPTEEIAFLSRLPPKTAPQDAVSQTELARKGRENGGVAKRIGRVQHVEASAKAFRIRGAEQEIADERLRRRDQLIGQHVPRTDLQAARLHERLEVVLALGTRAQVVLKQYGLPVQQEGAKTCVGLKPLDQVVKHRDEPGLEGRAREVPLPVPVSMGDEVEDQAAHARLR